MTGPAEIVVVGGGVAGLTAAFDLLRAGHRVTVLEAGERLGGVVAGAEIGGVRVDVGAESFAIAGGVVQQLIDDLGIGDAVVRPRASPAWVRHSRGSAPLPAGGWLGIPSRPLAADVRRVIGWTGALRASIDGVLPTRVGRRAGSIGDLVRARMGGRVLARLVDPVLGGVYSIPANRLPMGRLPAPARAVLARQRTLAAAASEVRGGSTAPGAPVAGLRGGMYELVTALERAITALGGEVRTQAAVTALQARPDRTFRLTAGSAWQADATVLAGSAASSCDLLGVASPVAPTGQVLLCTLVVDRPALDVAPRGSGMLVAADVPDVAAKAMTHATAKWEWLATRAGSGRHVLRLSYGRIGDGALPDAAAFPALALGDAGRLLGMPLRADHLVDWRLTWWPVSGAAAATPPTAPAGAVVTGGWIAGTGLAAVIRHARTSAAELTAQLGVPASAPGQGSSEEG